MATKKRTWKFWVLRTLLALLLIGGVWLTNLIWFRPYNIRHFYDKVFCEICFKKPGDDYSTWHPGFVRLDEVQIG